MGEDEHVELRIPLACELAVNADVYLNDAFIGTGMEQVLPFTKCYASYTYITLHTAEADSRCHT